MSSFIANIRRCINHYMCTIASVRDIVSYSRLNAGHMDVYYINFCKIRAAKLASKQYVQ